METKPYNLQSPEAIAKEYGGNKMKIAQAAQFGLLDPTAAVLAGMFIDRMRGAQQQEQAPQQTVAQQVLAPQPAAPQMPAGAGLGATPQASQLAAAYPAEGAPPPVPGPSMPQEEPVMAADGGLMSLPVDDSMFEPSYNSGGIVAFAAGSKDTVRSGITDEDARRLGYGSAEEYEAFARMRGTNMGQTFPVPDPNKLDVAPLEGSSGVLRGEGLTVSTEPRKDEREGQGFGSVTRPSVGDGVTDAQAASTAAPPAVVAPAVVDKGPAGNVKTVTNEQVADAAIAADPKAAEAAAKKGGIPGLQAYVQQYKDLIGAVPEGEGLKEYKEYLKGLPGELDKRKKEDLYGALAQFGFNLAGSQSPYFLQAAGQAGAQTMPAITGAIKERRGAEAEARKGRAELDKMTRAEEIKAIEGGAKLYSDEETRRAQERAALASANKPTDMRSYVNDYVGAARARGDNETPEAVLRQMGTENYLKLYSASDIRARAAASQAQTAETQAQTNIQDRARDNVDGSLAKNWNSPENKEIRKRQKADRADGTNTAQTYVDELYRKEESRLRGSQPAPAPAPAPAPKAETKPATTPQAAPKGQFEVKAPNGRVYYFPTKEAADAFAKSFGTK
jgi:hypothetical protein